MLNVLLLVHSFEWDIEMSKSSGEGRILSSKHSPFKILSPNTNMFKTGSTSMAWKMATVATGSTADIKLPNAKLSTKFTVIRKT